MRRDGLTNLQEYQLGTDPTDPDTDGDGFSDGLEAAASTPPLDRNDPIAVTPLSAKSLPDGQKRGIFEVVSTTGSSTGAVYSEALDRTSGIRLEGGTAAQDRSIEVIGVTGTTLDDERCLTNCVIREKDSGSVRPIGLNNISVGGAAGSGQRGVSTAYGLNNIGLLVRTWGKVIQREPGSAPSWFIISDGSGCPVKVKLLTGITAPALDAFVVVTGACSCEKSGSELLRLIRVRGDADILSL